MAQGSKKSKYKLRITAKEMQEKTYRKYLYPQIIDGITYEDDTEKKLSESSWFRCLTPHQQIAVEKEMRLRMEGAFSRKVLVYRDADNDCAPSIAKPVFTRLAESFVGAELRVLMRLIPYIHPNDGALRNAKNELLTLNEYSELCGIAASYFMKYTDALQEKRVLIRLKERPIEKNLSEDLFIDLALREQMTHKERELFDAQRKLLIYINPFVVFERQYIDMYTMPYFQNSGWYAINPYASKILDWITNNCK